MNVETKTVGEALIDLLEAQGVDTVFGIPASIPPSSTEASRGRRSVTSRPGTSRARPSWRTATPGACGKPGVCFLITGPGLTNALTAMAQAREDSIPMLVVTGVNARRTLGRGQGHLHEQPDQRGSRRRSRGSRSR